MRPVRFVRAAWLGGASALLLAGVAALGCARTAPIPATTSPNPQWEVLFDGSGLDRWRGFRRADVPASWRVEEGALAFRPVDDAGQRGDLVTRDTYGDFELELEWRVSEGGNSGIIFRVGEDQRSTWLTGPEMQVLDDARHADGKIPSHRAGALYDLVVPPDGVAKPVGEWNHARIVVRGGRIQQWLNGRSTADIEIGSDAWARALAASKFRDTPTYASLASGHIALQDHGDPVWFRNIRIRRLSPER